MTANNGWPGKPGVPLNPERDGWHWFVRGDFYSAALWHRGHFSFLDTTIWPEEFSQLDIIYAGPCLTPDEAAALQVRADRNAAGFARVDAEAERAKFLHKQEIAALQKRVAKLERLVQCLIDEDPNDMAADGGVTVLDVWRKEANAALTGGKDE